MLKLDTPALQPGLDVSDIESVTRAANAIDHEVRTVLSGIEARDCYVTYATPEYALGLVVLLRSLRRHTSRPVIVLTDRPWTFETKEKDVFVVAVPRLGNKRYAPSRPEIRTTLVKLWIFGLVSLRRVVYLDADCLLLRSIEDLFERAGMWCAPDYVEDATSARFNSGLIAFDPNIALRDRIFSGASDAESYDHGDQGLLNTLVADQVNFLEPEYSITRHYGFFHGPEVKIADAKVIHYIVKKPWTLSLSESPDMALVELDDRWTDELTHSELKSLVSVWRRQQVVVERWRFESPRPGILLSTLLGSAKFRHAAMAGVAGVLAILAICSVALLIQAIAALP